MGQFWDNYFSSKVLILLVLLMKINKSSQVPKKRVSKTHHTSKNIITKTRKCMKFTTTAKNYKT